MIIKLLIFSLVNSIIFLESKGNLDISVPENVSACVIHQDNDTLLNVQWIIKDAVNSGSAFYSVFFSSNDGFEFRFDQEPGNLETMISNISIPTNFTGQQMQVQVAFTVNSQEGVRSTPLTVDIRPAYLASFEVDNSTGNVTTLEITFNLSCDIESGITYIMDIIPLNNIHSNTSQTQIHNITNEDIGEKNLFRPRQVLLSFSNIVRGLEYTVQARLFNSERDMIGPDFKMNISIPFAIVTSSTTTTTKLLPRPTIQPVPSNAVPPTVINGTKITNLITIRSMEPTTTVSNNTPTPASNDLEQESDDSSSIGIAIGVSIGCVLLLVLAIALCIIIALMKKNDNRKKCSSKESDTYSVPEESFERLSYNSTTSLHDASPMQDLQSHQGRTLQNHDYSLPPNANYILYEEAPQAGNTKSNNNSIPSHYETADNQEIRILPFLSIGHYEMSDTIIGNPGNANQTYYSELVHNSHQNDNYIPPVPSGAYNYDQLRQSTNETMNTDNQNYYDSLTNTENTSHHRVQENNGYTELQDSTDNQNRPYQSLTNSNRTQIPKFHQYEEVKSDKGTVAVDQDYSEPYNVKHKKLLPNHQYDTVTGEVNPLPKRPFVKEYSEPRDTLNILLH